MASNKPRRSKASTDPSPLVSVIVPAWNAEATLAETLLSVVRQTYRAIEIIIVDDGSTDGTAEIARDFCVSEARARLIRQSNGGVALARNRGIAESNGEWIAPIDADDLWHPTRIEKMVATAVSSSEQPGFVYCWCRNIDRDGRITGTGPRLRVQGRAFTRLAFLNAVGNGSALLAARRALLEIGGYDPSLRAGRAQGAEDMLVQIRLARRHPVALVPEHLVGWRNAGGSMSSDVEQMDRSIRLVYRRLAEDGTPIPKRLQRGMTTMSALDVVENYAVRGKVGRAFRWLGRSLRLDPLRSSLFVAYRVVRSARRRLGPAPPVRKPLHFYDADPAAWIKGDPYRLDRFANLLEAIDRRKLNRLATAESSLTVV